MSGVQMVKRYHVHVDHPHKRGPYCPRQTSEERCQVDLSGQMQTGVSEPVTVFERGQVGVELPPSIGAKVLLLDTMLEQHVTPAELVRRLRLHTRPQSVSCLVNLDHATKIDKGASALKVLGRRMDLVVR